MTNKSLSFFALTLLILSCQTEQDKIKLEVVNFNTFADSLMAVNKNYVEVLKCDTQMLDIVDPSNPELQFHGPAVVLHSNIFDTTTEFTKTKMALTLEKYNKLEINLDSNKTKMNESTVKIFEKAKANIRRLMQPLGN